MKPIPELIKTNKEKWYVRIDAPGIYAETEEYETSNEALDNAREGFWEIFEIVDYYTFEMTQ